jgi:hypothetical protein
MMRTFGRLSMTRAQAARAFGRRSAARFRLPLYALSRYPWPTQRSPRFVFVVLLARWLTNKAAKEKALSAGRRSSPRRREAMRRQAAGLHIAGRSTRSTMRRQTSRIAKTLRVSARVAPATPARLLSERRITARATARRTIAYRRVAPSYPAIALQGATVPSREVVKRRWLRRDRVWRQVETRFVERTARAMFVAIAPPPSRATNEVRAWRSPRSAAHVVMQSARRRREAAPRRADASRRRVAMIARSTHRSHMLTNLRSVKSLVLSSTLRPVQPHRTASDAGIVGATHAARDVFERPKYRLKRTDRTTAASFARYSGRLVAAAGTHDIVHRAESSRRRLLIKRSGSTVRERTLAIPARYESVARPTMIVRQRIEPAGSRQDTTAGTRQAQSSQRSRGGSWSHQDGRSDNRSPRPPAVEEVRRILIPLLQETLFSERTMGRLANGVASDIDRRDSVERYRKTGGR